LKAVININFDHGSDFTDARRNFTGMEVIHLGFREINFLP
jgi:hypothetical protein